MAGAGLRRHGREWLNSIELLPTECDAIVADAIAALADRKRTQTDIYAEFVERCEALMAEHRGELEFDIPSMASFNRYSLKLAKISRRLDQTREMVSILAEKYDPKTSDDLTILTGETIKALVLHMMGDVGDAGMEPKDAMNLASAFRQAVQAQAISSARKREEKKFEKSVKSAVDRMAKAQGLTAETAEGIKAQILGIAGPEGGT